MMPLGSRPQVVKPSTLRAPCSTASCHVAGLARRESTWNDGDDINHSIKHEDMILTLHRKNSKDVKDVSTSKVDDNAMICVKM
jgi:hypothetical protein